MGRPKRTVEACEDPASSPSNWSGPTAPTAPSAPSGGRPTLARRRVLRTPTSRRGDARAVAAVTAAAVPVLALLIGPAPAGAAEPAPAVRVGLVTDAAVPEADATVTAFRDALRGRSHRGRPIEILSRTASEPESAGRAALAEMAIEGAEVIVAFGDDLARVAATAVRDRPVVAIATRSDAGAGDRVRTVSWAPDPSRVAEEVRRMAPTARHVGVAGPGGGLAETITAAFAPRGGAAPTVDRLIWSAATGTFGADISADEVVVAAADVPPEQVTDLARRLHGQAVALVGTRASHLDAGAAIVICTRPADVGALAATAVFDALSGRRPAAPIVHPRSIAREIHIPNARRLRFAVPLAVLAASDRTVPATPERR